VFAVEVLSERAARAVARNSVGEAISVVGGKGGGLSMMALSYSGTEDAMLLLAEAPRRSKRAAVDIAKGDIAARR